VIPSYKKRRHWTSTRGHWRWTELKKTIDWSHIAIGWCSITPK